MTEYRALLPVVVETSGAQMPGGFDSRGIVRPAQLTTERPTFRLQTSGMRTPRPRTSTVRTFVVRTLRAQRSTPSTTCSLGLGSSRGSPPRGCSLHDGPWSYHLNADDVAALVDNGRLMDFTHDWNRESGWTPKDPAPEVNPRDVNEWSLTTFGHDAINCGTVVRARCEREGVPGVCAECDGHGSREAWIGQREHAEAWAPIEPLTGEGWQLWETTSEGEPVSPVFATPEELADWCVDGATIFGESRGTREQWIAIVTGEDFARMRGRFGHRQVVAVHVLDGTGWVEPGSGSCELQRWRCSFAVGDSCGQGGYRG